MTIIAGRDFTPLTNLNPVDELRVKGFPVGASSESDIRLDDSVRAGDTHLTASRTVLIVATAAIVSNSTLTISSV